MTGSQLSVQTRIRSSLAAVRLGTRNAVKCSHDPAETEEHRWVKWQVAEFCYKNQLQFVTEASLKGGGRADIVVLDWGVILEICNTEEIRHALKKEYPLPILAISSAIPRPFLHAMLMELNGSSGEANIIRHYQERMKELTR